MAEHSEDTFTLEEDTQPTEQGGILGRFRRDRKPKEPRKRDPLPRGHPNADEIAELVSLGNLPIVMVSPRDALTANEAKQLADALSTYAQTNEVARRWMYGIIRKSALFALLNVGIMLALPRLIRHGILPPQLANYLVNTCDPDQLADAIGMTRRADGAWEFSPNGTTPQGEYSRPSDIPAMGAA